MSQKLNSHKVPYQEIPCEARNQKIYWMYQSGSYSYNSLSRIYKLSPQRIAEIIKRIAELKAKNHAKYERSKEIKEFSNWANKRADEIGKNLPKV